MVPWASKDAGVRHCATGCGNNVEGFCGAEGRAAGFFADGAEGCAGEETGIVGFGGCAIGGFGWRSGGGCGLLGRRVRLGLGCVILV